MGRCGDGHIVSIGAGPEGSVTPGVRWGLEAADETLDGHAVDGTSSGEVPNKDGDSAREAGGAGHGLAGRLLGLLRSAAAAGEEESGSDAEDGKYKPHEFPFADRLDLESGAQPTFRVPAWTVWQAVAGNSAGLG